jgi:hypothetical protein
MKLDALLRAHGFMKVERPPELWEADTDDTRFIPLLGEMIAGSLARSKKDLGELTLNASNVVVPLMGAEDGHGPAAGEYVAITISGDVIWTADAVWAPGQRLNDPWLADLNARLEASGSPYAYIRKLDPQGSITVFLPRSKEEEK